MGGKGAILLIYLTLEFLCPNLHLITKPTTMKNVFVLFLVIILVTGCNQPLPEIHQVEIGLYTPYFLFPETLQGKVKSVIEKNYLAVEQDGKYIKDIPLTVGARDSIGWTTDF